MGKINGLRGEKFRSRYAALIKRTTLCIPLFGIIAYIPLVKTIPHASHAETLSCISLAKLIPHVFPAPTVPCKIPVPRRHFLHFPGERLLCAFIPAEQVIEYIHRKLILIVRDDYLIPALAEIVGCRAHCALQL